MNHLIRAIRYKPNDIELRKRYLLHFIEYLEANKRKFVQRDLEIYEKEFSKFAKYLEMEEGRESDLLSLTLTILEKIDFIANFALDREEGPLTSFTEQWKSLNSRYRPVEQALDYASQIIYNQYNSR